MYTELIFSASFKKETPEEIIEIIRDLSERNPAPNSPFFNMRNVLLGSSAYFPAQHCIFNQDFEGQWVLNSRANIKNYENEIEFFLKFVEPHLDHGAGNENIYAYVHYEESEFPLAYRLTDND